MRVLIYHCPEAPTHLAYSGQFLVPEEPKPGKKASGKEVLFGIRFDGPEAESIRTKMEAFWAERTDAEAAKVAAARDRADARRKARAALSTSPGDA